MKMNCLIFLFTTLTCYSIAVPNVKISNSSPNKILSISQELHDLTYYEEQVQLWKAEIKNDEKDANAWMNYYLANRIINMLSPNGNQNDLQKIYNQLSTKIEGSYEYHYLTYLNGKGDESLFHHIETAFNMDSDRTEALSHLVNHYAVSGDYELMTKYNKLWLESGDISSGILNWNYNSLIGLEKNAILLTYGDNDTYPSWMLQQVQSIRTDVKVINIHLMRKREYIDHVFTECGISKYPKQEGETLVWETDLLPIVDHMFTHSDRPVYVNVTLPKKIRDNYQDVLYTIGLAFKFSPEPFDNITMLKNNYENKFLTDYLRMGFSYDKSVSVLNSMNVNYLPAFISLYKHYIKSENNDQADNIREVIQNIGEASGRQEEIAAIIEKPRVINKKIESHFKIKQIDKLTTLIKPGLYANDENGIKLIEPSLYAFEVETTNELYDQFLMDLLKEKEFDLLEICRNEKVDWIKLLPEKFKYLSEDIIYRNADPRYPGAPVVNVSYEAAVIYCEWLTMVYNGYDKKKRFQKVVFRLPTEKEWEHAAYADKNAPYPWGGYYVRNPKGCILGNFYSSDEEPCTDCNYTSVDIDGAFFPAKADAYFPNDFGLYNMSGNVSEMIGGGQITKGGSWSDYAEDCKIDSKKTYDGPSPSVGFRVFMEVIR
jgi:hypothetical protein